MEHVAVLSALSDSLRLPDGRTVYCELDGGILKVSVGVGIDHPGVLVSVCEFSIRDGFIHVKNQLFTATSVIQFPLDLSHPQADVALWAQSLLDTLAPFTTFQAVAAEIWKRTGEPGVCPLPPVHRWDNLDPDEPITLPDDPRLQAY